jgi:hypothetical protein
MDDKLTNLHKLNAMGKYPSPGKSPVKLGSVSKGKGKPKGMRGGGMVKKHDKKGG